MFLAVFVSGCGDNEASFPKSLSQKWKLKQLYNANSAIPMSHFANDDGAFVEFRTDGSINGHAGCNTFFGNYISSADNDIQFGGVGMTRKMCGPQSMAVEDVFIKLFADGGGTISKIDGKTLVLKRDNVQAVLEQVDNFELRDMSKRSIDE